jgi:protein-disulfide isomerase
MNRKTAFIVTAVVLLGVFAVATLLFRTARVEQSNAAAPARQAMLLRFHAPSVGGAGAKVQIVEFLDPACETCREFYPAVKSIVAGDPEKIRLSVRHVALHQGAEHALRVLEAAKRQGKYWQTLEALLAAQPQWVRNHVVRPEAVIPAIAAVGLDVEQLKRDMNDPEVMRLIEIDRADAQALNVTKTPEFFVNGRQLPSFGYEQLRRLVAEELQKTYR